MLEKYFNILLVDDEPDVLAISKIALRRVKIYGVPLRIHEAGSKAAAVEILTSHPERRRFALAIIDVVMESDHAGLELCQFVREDLKNSILPLLIRTGQAGKAPEREVIDRYEITGYINKVEATEDRLYSLIKAGVRQYAMTAYDHYASQLLYHVITNMRSAARFKRAVQAGLQVLTQPAPRVVVESLHGSHAMVSTTFFAGTGELEDAARAHRLVEHMQGLEGVLMSPSGDRMVVDDKHMMLHIEPTRDFARPLQSLWTLGAAPQPFSIKALYMVTRQLQVLMNTVTR